MWFKTDNVGIDAGYYTLSLYFWPLTISLLNCNIQFFYEQYNEPKSGPYEPAVDIMHNNPKPSGYDNTNDRAWPRASYDKYCLLETYCNP